MLSIPLLACLLAIVPSAFAQSVDPDLVASLKTAATQPDRIALLKDEQFVFNFLAGVGTSRGSGGRLTNANAGNFPALVGNGISMSLGYLEPCGLNTPHTHPRATEINIAVNGTLRTGMLAENGARFVFNDVPPGSVTVFPQGAIHFEMNLGCEPMIFVAGFNNEDPGTSAVAQRFLGLPIDIVSSTLDSLGIQEIAGLEAKIPNNAALGTEECLQRCGISNITQPTTQRQPRVAANALPPGFSGPPPPAPQPSPSRAARSLGDQSITTTPPTFNAASIDPDDRLVGRKDAQPFLIALLVINGAFAVGTLVALVLYLKTRASKHQRIQESIVSRFARLREAKDPEYYDPYQRPSTPTRQ